MVGAAVGVAVTVGATVETAVPVGEGPESVDPDWQPTKNKTIIKLR